MRTRTITLAVIALLAIGVNASTAEAAPLPTGTWSCASNGFLGTFLISAVSGAGVLTSTFFGSPVFGTYDSNANRITFLRQGPGDSSTDQTYVGYLFSTSAPANTYLTGHFIALPGTGGTAARPEYGWACVFVAP